MICSKLVMTNLSFFVLYLYLSARYILTLNI